MRRGDRQELISRWDHFWFASCPTPALDLVRIFFGLTVLQFLTGLWGLYRLKDLSPRFPRSPVFESALLYRGVPMPYPGLSWLPKAAPNLQFHLELMLLILAVCMTVGLASRYVIPLLSIGFTYLFFQTQWNYHHHSFLVVLVLAVLSFAPCGEHFGVDAALARKKLASQSVFPLRLIQVLVIILYGFSFLSKLRHGWVEGSAISLLAEGGRIRGPLGRLALDLGGPQAMGVATVAAEGLVFVGLMKRRFRLSAIVLGVILHLSVDAVMDVGTFSYEMIALYFSFFGFVNGGENNVLAGSSNLENSANSVA